MIMRVPKEAAIATGVATFRVSQSVSTKGTAAKSAMAVSMMKRPNPLFGSVIFMVSKLRES
jgi:hypothetical protein